MFCRSPFDLSLATLAVMCVIIGMKWVENYGDSTATTLHSFGAALTAIRTGQFICLVLPLASCLIYARELLEYVIFIVWGRSVNKMLLSVKFAEDKVLTFLIHHDKC